MLYLYFRAVAALFYFIYLVSFTLVALVFRCILVLRVKFPTYMFVHFYRITKFQHTLRVHNMSYIH